jgi:DNA-directed RNA polymerase specialized sigma subunit
MISYNIRNILQISDERRKRVIDLYFNQHKTYAEIGEIERRGE